MNSTYTTCFDVRPEILAPGGVRTFIIIAVIAHFRLSFGYKPHTVSAYRVSILITDPNRITTELAYDTMLRKRGFARIKSKRVGSEKAR